MSQNLWLKGEIKKVTQKALFDNDDDEQAMMTMMMMMMMIRPLFDNDDDDDQATMTMMMMMIRPAGFALKSAQVTLQAPGVPAQTGHCPDVKPVERGLPSSANLLTCQPTNLATWQPANLATCQPTNLPTC